MNLSPFFAGLLVAVCSASAFGQALVSGRVVHSRWTGSTNMLPLANVLCVASSDGAGRAPAAFRTWETDPAGWFRLSIDTGSHTLLFTQPASFFRPVIWNNVLLRADEKLDSLRVTPSFDYAVFDEAAWDPKAGTDYFQTFIARGRSVTAIGFRLAHDGVDGFGPGTQSLLVSIHRRGDGPPEAWPQIGPTGLVPSVDSGGPKNYLWAAGWNSGEVPLQPGETYAVHLQAEKTGNGFQPFWHPAEVDASRCYRRGTAGTNGWTDRQLWLAVATDADGLLVPYNKRVQKTFGNFGGFAQKWSQTWVAQGRSLAGVTLYAAVGGAQPPLGRQRATVRVRAGGPTGPAVGLEKIAIGNGIYTGDASWGVFTTAFAPGEVPLEPGQSYAVEFESLERFETIHGFVNIKNQVSDDRPGFNPYQKVAPDTYPSGAAYKFGTNEMPFDLDLQIIEYANNAGAAASPANIAGTPSPALRIAAVNLLSNGTFESARAHADFPAWIPVTVTGAPQFVHGTDQEAPTNHLARLIGPVAQAFDGALVQPVTGLARADTYRLTARVRSSWTTDFDHQTLLGVDLTGQTTNATAPTIRWQSVSALHGYWTDVAVEPVRPATNAVSVWLRARTSWTSDKYAPFRAEFDDVTLRRVVKEPPQTATGP